RPAQLLRGVWKSAEPRLAVYSTFLDPKPPSSGRQGRFWIQNRRIQNPASKNQKPSDDIAFISWPICAVDPNPAVTWTNERPGLGDGRGRGIVDRRLVRAPLGVRLGEAADAVEGRRARVGHQLD